jgi:hypothetical protein
MSMLLRAKLPSLLCTAAMLAVVPGCLPAVAWLPDSSGFVYTSGFQLLH